MKTIKHDVLVWAGRLAQTFPLRGLLYRKESQRCGHSVNWPAVVHSGTRLHKWTLQGTHMKRFSFNLCLQLCFVKSPLPIAQVYFGQVWAFSLDCNFRFPFLMIGQDLAWGT